MNENNKTFMRGLFFAVVGTLGVVCASVAAAYGAQQYANAILMFVGALWYISVRDILSGCRLNINTKENDDDG